ncbi:hypothetical protein FPV67DRAFT_1572599 [Lyophyllum atratum]|nr:hypothetical protein FPV67DRAFT_1572599 [Lyophyllum atratum]
MESPGKGGSVDGPQAFAKGSANLEYLCLLPLFETERDESLSVTGYDDFYDDLDGHDLAWNVTANTTMRQERQKLAGKRKKLDLSIFLDFPLDLIFEIFGHLHPIDIYHIAQTNKTLRKMVLAPNSASLWKTCFICHPSIPECPTDMSEPRWATLLFGPAICDECARPGAMLDFAFLRHLCTRCLNHLCVFRVPTDGSVAPFEENNLVWDLVPATPRFSGSNYWGHYEFQSVRLHGRYMLRDLLSTAQKLEVLQNEIAQDKVGSEEAFEDFKKATQRHAIHLLKDAERCSIWAQNIMEINTYDIRVRRDHIVKRVEARLLALGHHPDDIISHELENLLFYSSSMPEIRRLTRQVWRNVRPVAEALIATIKERKRLEAWKLLLSKRGPIIKSAYLEYQQTLAPSSWNMLPDYEELLHYEEFSALLNDTSENDLTVAACGVALSKLPEYLTDWRQKRIRHLLAQLPDLEVPSVMHLFADLELATSVFTCLDCKNKNADGLCLFGWDDVRAHVRCPTLVSKGHTNLILCTAGSTVSAELVSFLGLDPVTASTSDMDRLATRLICARCPIQGYRGIRGHPVYTWRELITHAVRMQGDAEHSKDAWHLLTPEVTTLVLHREDRYPHAGDKAWSCNHCSVHFHNFVKHRDVIDHVKDIHQIQRPVEGVDHFHSLGPEAQHTSRRPVALAESPTAEFRCARCLDLGFRLFASRNISSTGTLCCASPWARADCTFLLGFCIDIIFPAQY